MPVIFPYTYATSWVKSTKHLSDVLRMLEPLSSKMMNAYPVSELINQPDVNDPVLVQAVGEKLQAEIEFRPVIRSHYGHKVKSTSTIPYSWPNGEWV